jgi:hypothetical protein
VSDEDRYTEQEAHRLFAGKFNGEVWGLLEKPDRSHSEEELMVHTAHASCCHWLKVGTGLHHQRAEWLLARVYSELGMVESALWHARRCGELTDEYTELMEDFDRAYALECMGRANAVAGNREEALRYVGLAEKMGAAIKDEESRKIFRGDLDSGNWAGMR